jgi:hypothetical protein
MTLPKALSGKTENKFFLYFRSSFFCVVQLIYLSCTVHFIELWRLNKWAAAAI